MLNYANSNGKGYVLDPKKPMFSISIIANLLKLHQRTLRIYDEENLLCPSRSPKNRRLYSCEDIERGRFIQYLTRELGINLAGVKIILHLLAKQKVRSTDSIAYISKMADELKISSESQEITKLK